jgi:hypothetical protein
MAVNATAIKQLSDLGTAGTVLGQSATDLVALYGATAVSQRSSSNQATSNISAYTATSASALIGATLLEVANTLIGLGIWKGS